MELDDEPYMSNSTVMRRLRYMPNIQPEKSMPMPMTVPVQVETVKMQPRRVRPEYWLKLSGPTAATIKKKNYME
jgi:hypothetical protein